MTERRETPVTGDVIEDGSVRAYAWEWTEIGGPAGRSRSRLPWFGIFLVVFGVLLLLRAVFPALETAGSLLFLAVGVAFLVSWLVNRGMGSLYLGSIIVALAAPDLLVAAGFPDQSGLGTLCLGLAFLFIALVRGVSGGGVGWQAGSRRDPRPDRCVELRDPRLQRLLLADHPRRARRLPAPPRLSHTALRTRSAARWSRVRPSWTQGRPSWSRARPS